jgi:hypothetical protein
LGQQTATGVRGPRLSRVLLSPFTVTGEPPPETAFVSCVATGGGVCGGSSNERAVSFDSLAAEASVSISLVAAVSCALTDGTEMSNSVTLHSSTPDPEADVDESANQSTSRAVTVKVPKSQGE